MAKRGREEGTIIRGVDGELYFLPDSALKAYRLPVDQERTILAGVPGNGHGIRIGARGLEELPGFCLAARGNEKGVVESIAAGATNATIRIARLC